jgi:hypothetical protein
MRDVKVFDQSADRAPVNTIAATSSRIPRAGLIALVALVVAFALFMVVRSGVLGGSDSGAVAVAPPATSVTPTKPQGSSATPAKPAVVLLPGLPTQVAAKLRYSKVVVVSVYLPQAVGDRAAADEVRRGARAAGAGFVAVNVANDKNAKEMRSFVGAISSPTMLVVRRPGKIVTQIPGAVEAAVVTQAAHNAGARLR